MRTNIEIDDEKISKLMEFTGITTKKEIVDRALENYLQKLSKSRLLNLMGQIEWEGNLEESRTEKYEWPYFD